MNEAKTLLEAGNLSGAIEAALGLVKKNPTDVAARIFLFELSIFAGDWDRAKRQLDVIGHQDTVAMIGSKILEQCVLAENKRAEFFAKGTKPTFLDSPPDYIYGLLTANNRMIEGNLTEAQEILGKVDEQRPAFACRINGEEIADFRDYNDPTSVVLEVIIKDDYVLVPFEQIERITFSEPKSLRDYFWRQATLETGNGTNGEVFVPTLYNDSWRNGDDRIRLGKATDWRELDEDIYVGEGAKLFAVGAEHKTIFDLETIEFVKE
ncbi:MAG TPA: type VI secretion system accessory protein TagJ [Pyrinomonadaceae bacterium]|jgi:type VI secretion system protein ImpE